MYRSPVEMDITEKTISEMQDKIVADAEEFVYQAIMDVGVKVDKAELIKALQYDRDQYEKGRWDMFIEASNAYHGKQYYFEQRDGSVYSRESGRYLTKDEAIKEFLSCCNDF